MDNLVPASKISDMATGWICGQTARDFVKTKTAVSYTHLDVYKRQGLYVPNSQFRETSKDVASGAMSGNMNMSMGSTGNSLAPVSYTHLDVYKRQVQTEKETLSTNKSIRPITKRQMDIWICLLYTSRCV